jgi:hypothetical protein
LTRARIFLTQARDSGVAGFEHSVLDVTDPDSIVVTGNQAPRLIFPVSHAGSALRLYHQLADSTQSPAVSQAIAGSSQADFRFTDSADGGRLFLKP